MSDETIRKLYGSNADLSEKRSITLGALTQAFFTFLSRILGMIRDVMVSHIFGAGALTDAFLISFTIPNVLRQFFGEGAFSAAFVPIYVSVKEEQGLEEAKAFYRNAFGFLLISLTLVTLLGMYFSKEMVQLFAMGFSYDEEQLSLASTMTRWLFPYILLISLVALFGALLACYKRFAAMAAAPMLLNLAMISSMVLWTDLFEQSIYMLVVGVLAGGVLQLLLMIMILKRSQLWIWPKLSFRSEAMVKFLKLLAPGLFGVFVYQLNIIVLRQLASFLGDGQISYYYNADRLAQFAMGVFAVSIATSSLPELSRGFARSSIDGYYETLRFTMAFTSFLLTPCALGLFVFAKPIVSVLFVHGAFTYDDALITARTLMAFCPSLLAFGLSRTLIQAFYAQGDTKTPVLVGVVTVIMNLGLGLMLLRYEVVGLAATLSVSSCIQFFLLLWLFKRRSEGGFSLGLFYSLSEHLMVSAVACGVGIYVAKLGEFSDGFSIKNAVVLTMVSIISAGSYFLFAYYFRSRMARRFVDDLRTRFFG